jgi:hypothetical protein
MDHQRIDRVGFLSPLEESSAEISKDSGIVSQSASSLSMVSEILSSGTVSQSPSFGAAAVSQSPSFNEPVPGIANPDDSDQEDDALLRYTALSYSSYVRATAGEEVRGMLIRLDAANHKHRIRAFASIERIGLLHPVPALTRYV